MSRYHAYITIAERLIRDYRGTGPLALYLKQYFKLHKKHGGNDRKVITRLCFGFFRGGFAFTHLSPERQLLAGYYLQAKEPDALMDSLCPDWPYQPELSQRIRIVAPEVDLTEFYHSLCPFPQHLSRGIDARSFALSLLQQPGFFLRLRPGKEERVIRQLNEAGFHYQQRGPQCLALDAATSVEAILTLDRDAVIQDLSSQQIATLFPDFEPGQQVGVWDCCAASGGKSLLAIDRYPSLSLTVSDIRENSLHNLSHRLARAGFSRFQRFTVDLTVPLPNQSPLRAAAGPGFDLVIADVPCSGSGTWGRTPEQRYHFKEADLIGLVERQRQILRQVIPRVKHGGYLLYCTCSVFAAENEQQVEAIATDFNLTLQRMEWFNGFQQGADTLFAALFKA